MKFQQVALKALLTVSLISAVATAQVPPASASAAVNEPAGKETPPREKVAGDNGELDQDNSVESNYPAYGGTRLPIQSSTDAPRARTGEARNGYSPGQSKRPDWREWKGLVIYLSALVLGFAFLTLTLASVLLWRLRSPPQVIVKVFGLVVILGFSSLLLIVGYSDDQLTPIVGLFGAIAGYLLGKDSGSGDRTTPQ